MAVADPIQIILTKKHELTFVSFVCKVLYSSSDASPQQYTQSYV